MTDVSELVDVSLAANSFQLLLPARVIHGANGPERLVLSHGDQVTISVPANGFPFVENGDQCLVVVTIARTKISPKSDFETKLLVPGKVN